MIMFIQNNSAGGVSFFCLKDVLNNYVIDNNGNMVVNNMSEEDNSMSDETYYNRYRRLKSRKVCMKVTLELFPVDEEHFPDFVLETVLNDFITKNSDRIVMNNSSSTSRNLEEVENNFFTAQVNIEIFRAFEGLQNKEMSVQEFSLVLSSIVQEIQSKDRIKSRSRFNMKHNITENNVPSGLYKLVELTELLISGIEHIREQKHMQTPGLI